MQTIIDAAYAYRPLSRRLDRCDRVIQDEADDSNGGNVYYVTMRITFVTRKFGNVERNSHCDVLHITPVRVARLVLDCNGVFAIKAYGNGHDIVFKITKSPVMFHDALKIGQAASIRPILGDTGLNVVTHLHVSRAYNYQ